MSNKKAIVPIGRIENRILLIRGEKVIVDADLASNAVLSSLAQIFGRIHRYANNK